MNEYDSFSFQDDQINFAPLLRNQGKCCRCDIFSQFCKEIYLLTRPFRHQIPLNPDFGLIPLLLRSSMPQGFFSQGHLRVEQLKGVEKIPLAKSISIVYTKVLPIFIFFALNLMLVLSSYVSQLLPSNFGQCLQILKFRPFFDTSNTLRKVFILM